MDFNLPFGAWLKARRKQLDLTQVELARRAHYAPVSLRRIEERGLPASRALAAALIAPLEVPESEREAFIAFARGVDVRQRLNHLPVPVTALLGREKELAALTALLAPGEGDRLVTLIGPPGVGKSRLAMQLAHDLQPIYADGASFVALASVSDIAHIATAIANSLRQRALGRDSSIEAIADYLESRELLLSLDNFEHLLDGAPLISHLLARCPRLRVLVTSRAVMGLAGERLFEVEPLERGPAVALFARQAAGVKPSFALTVANGATVGEICQKLDDLPLAIELAAARARMLTPARMLERLTDHTGARFDLLTNGTRDADARQRTLRATIDWSYALLSAAEQRFLRRMGVFPGGCALDGAAAVCADTQGGSARDEAAAESMLQSLLDKSLIYETEGLDGAPRFNLLETIREYACDRLAEAGEGDETRRRLTEYLIALGDASRPYVPGADRIHWILRLGSERDNIASALAWCRSTTGDYALGLRLAGRMGWVVSWGDELRVITALPGTDVWLTDIEERIKLLPENIQAATLYGLGDLVHAAGDWENLRALFRLTEDIARRTGDWRTEADCIFTECIEHDYVEGDFGAALPHYLRMLDFTRRDPLRHAVSQCMLARAYVAYARPHPAIALLNEALDTFARHGITWTMFGGTAYAHEILSGAFMWLDKYEAAIAHAQKRNEEHAAIGMPYSNPVRLTMSALAAGRAGFFRELTLAHLGRPSVARAGHLRRKEVAISGIHDGLAAVHACACALRRHAELPGWVWTAALTFLGSQLAYYRRVPIALRLYGAAWARLPQAEDEPEVAALAERRLADLRAAALADDGLYEAWQVGERMTLDAIADMFEALIESLLTKRYNGRPQTAAP